jgi:hypothetical protein
MRKGSRSGKGVRGYIQCLACESEVRASFKAEVRRGGRRGSKLAEIGRMNVQVLSNVLRSMFGGRTNW